MTEDRFLTAQEAAAELGISLATLYAYASRGMLRSEPCPAIRAPGAIRGRTCCGSRRGRSCAGSRRRRRRRRCSWGTPVLESALTLVQDGRLYYRGRDAVALARTRHRRGGGGAALDGGSATPGGLRRQSRSTVPRWARSRTCRPWSAARWPCRWRERRTSRRWDLRPAAVVATGARILRLLAGGRRRARPEPSTAGIAGILQAGWAPDRPEAAGPIASALILSADHELNVSAFTARCVASAASSPYDVVVRRPRGPQGGPARRPHRAGGGAVPRGGVGGAEPGGCWRTACGGARRSPASAILSTRTATRGEPPSWRSPRASPRAPPPSSAPAPWPTAGRELIREHPTIDLGLVTLARALDLPERTPLALFALGRAIGWIGHAIEQYAIGRLIRPRAAYVGEMPGHPGR